MRRARREQNCSDDKLLALHKVGGPLSPAPVDHLPRAAKRASPSSASSTISGQRPGQAFPGQEAANRPRPRQDYQGLAAALLTNDRSALSDSSVHSPQMARHARLPALGELRRDIAGLALSSWSAAEAIPSRFEHGFWPLRCSTSAGGRGGRELGRASRRTSGSGACPPAPEVRLPRCPPLHTPVADRLRHEGDGDARHWLAGRGASNRWRRPHLVKRKLRMADSQARSLRLLGNDGTLDKFVLRTLASGVLVHHWRPAPAALPCLPAPSKLLHESHRAKITHGAAGNEEGACTGVDTFHIGQDTAHTALLGEPNCSSPRPGTARDSRTD